MAEPIVDKINQTIIILYEDCNRMIKFCKDEQDNVSKDFYDWYLKETPEFFIKSGMLIIDQTWGLDEMLPISFDFYNPDEALFTSYIYADQSKVASWKFKRQENLTMSKVSFEIAYRNMANINRMKRIILTSPKGTEKVADKYANHGLEAVRNKVNLINKKGFRSPPVKEIMADAERESMKLVLYSLCEASIYFIYSLMYYVSKQEPEIIESQYSKSEDSETQKVKAFYKYTGYVDLRENRVYRPAVERDPNIPAREYQRHIQAWTVRGHYRRTSKGLIWVEPHTKGKGELEKRIYGTEDEKDLNIIPKVFEVERSKGNPKAGRPSTDEEVFVNDSPRALIKEEGQFVEPKKPSKIRNLTKRFLKWLFG